MPKIYKVTQEQYNTLKSGTSIGGYSYDSSAIYLIQDTSTFAWVGGTSNGPTGNITSTSGEIIAVPAIPAASATASGIVTNGTQTFGGQKTFEGNLKLQQNAVLTSQGKVASLPLSGAAFTLLGCVGSLTRAVSTAYSLSNDSYVIINTGSASTYDILVHWGTCGAFYSDGSTTRSSFSINFYAKHFADSNYRIIVTPRWNPSSSSDEYASLTADVQFSIYSKSTTGASGYAMNSDKAYSHGGETLYFDYIAIGNIAKQE